MIFSMAQAPVLIQRIKIGFAAILRKKNFQVQCFPLESILSALYNPVVNLFVLDVEGFEFAILRAIDWTKVDIEVAGRIYR